MIFLSMRPHRERYNQHSVKPLRSMNDKNLSEMTQANYFFFLTSSMNMSNMNVTYMLHNIVYKEL